ncbi:hypothetical protein CULT_1370003 [[Clostridium] ultunense Esp]|nr:hypothetical protein CULT_1370003 [[Clostridium] ultunense Esp]
MVHSIHHERKIRSDVCESVFIIYGFNVFYDVRSSMRTNWGDFFFFKWDYGGTAEGKRADSYRRDEGLYGEAD